MAMSDPLSRGRLEEFRARCRQLGITPVRVELPPQCREIYDRGQRQMMQRSGPASTAMLSASVEPLAPGASRSSISKRSSPGSP